MEDDIDIEEHDLLDNPKIRDIFPDLSLVKIEAVDAEYDEAEENQPELPYAEYTVKQEPIDGYEGNDDNCQYEQNEQSYNDNRNFEQNEQIALDYGFGDGNCGFEQNEQSGQSELNGQSVFSSGIYEQEMQFSNKIILGTKPAVNYEVLYEEAKHSTVSVYLENWGEKLIKSPCYCQSCEILFPTVNALDAHNSISHSFLVALDTPRPNTARKSTVNTSSTYCNHCDRTFPNDTALITHLYELLPLNNFEKPTPQPVKVQAKSIKYKCTKCKKYFATFADGKRHKNLAHPTLGNANVIVGVSNKIDKPFSKQKETKEGKFFSSKSLVPKSVLFQCYVCQVNFFSCYSAAQHSYRCENKAEYHKCVTCKRKIRAKDALIHEHQHKYADKLKIYTVNKNMYEKVLLKCPKCDVCFDEISFWCHYQYCNGEHINCVRCNICFIYITKSRFVNHKGKHLSKKYTRKDFILVEFYDLSKINATQNHPRTDTLRDDPDTVLYYCSHCGSCKNVLSHRGHTNGSCETLNVKFCDICGLGFGRNNYKHHKILHTKKKLTLSDFKIYSLTTHAYIETPMSKFHRCSVCNIHFLTRECIRLHNCEKEPFESCKICNENFNLKAYVPHSNFHTFQDIPELLKKYNSINNMWNVVYLCVSCNLVTMTYDSAVEHSQNHINELPKPVSRLCQTCEFDIVEPFYTSHMKLHENNQSINRKKFTVLQYDYKNLYNKTWMTMLAPLPKQHKYQILSKSIYRYTRRFKLNCEINYQTDDIKFICKRCKTGVNMEDAREHYFSKTCKNSAEYVCRTCSLTFVTLQKCIEHESEHENTKKNYKVITFNDQKDELFDRRLKDFDIANGDIGTKQETVTTPPKLEPKKPKVTVSKIKKGSKQIPTGRGYLSQSAISCVKRSNRIKLYKCEKCLSCVSVRKNILQHSCSTYTESRKRLCVVCKEYFNCRHLHKHMQLHRLCPRLGKPLIIYFNPLKTKGMATATIFQCECGLHFTSKQSIDNHIEVCSDELEIFKEACSKCNLLFPTDVLVSHLCKHHSKPVDLNIELVKKPNKNPVKCAICKVVYANMNNFETHLFDCPVKNGKKCPECRFLIDPKMSGEHHCVGSDEMTIVKSSANINKLYRCHLCNITYLFKNSFHYHIEVKHVNHRQIVSCHVCKLRFTAQLLNKHMKIHEKAERYIIKVIEPETGRSSIVKGDNPKLGINTSSRKTKLDNSALNTSEATKNTKKNPEIVDQKMSKVFDQKMSKIVDQKMSKIVDQKRSKTDDVPEATCNIYRCTECDICYLYKKRWGYHIAVNHTTKREVVPCDVCGLRFAHNILTKHMSLHKFGHKYKIKLINPSTGDYKMLSGNNFESDTTLKNKRRSLPDDSIRKSKRVKRHTTSFDEQQPCTSKIETDSSIIGHDDTKNIESDVEYDQNSQTQAELTGDDVKTADDEKSDDEKPPKTLVDNSDYVEDARTTLYKCKACNLHFLTPKSIVSHRNRAGDNHKTEPHKCELCGLDFSNRTLPKHRLIHHVDNNLRSADMFNIVEMPFEEKVTPKTKCDVDVSKNALYIYYKCRECKVCFVDEGSCRKHCISHDILDPITYIECKICNYQFLIDSLKKHVTMHHSSEFSFEDLVVKEYTPTGDRHPKIDIYRGIDKVQSRLISTTTDVNFDCTDSDVVEA